MKNSIKSMALAAILAALFCGSALALDGNWRGKLSMGWVKVPMVFHFSGNADGTTSCTIDVPSQGATGIPATVIANAPDSLTVDCKVLGAVFKAKATEKTIAGNFSQRGITIPLTLTPDAPTEERRPQTPKPPFPYVVIDTEFAVHDGTFISGTMYIPRPEAGDGQKVPAVVMVTGSGPQNRDEELFEHKPFAVIADFLARNGVASFRYDDRGTGKSGGDFAKSPTYTFKDDARSAVKMMCEFPGIGRVGVLGHSEGGTIAFMLAGEKEADFIVSLAGMAVSGKETLLAQNARSLEKSGITGEAKDGSLRLIGLLFDEMSAQARTGENKPLDADSIAKANGIVVPEAIMASLSNVEKGRSPWFDTFVGLDPSASLSKITCPVLAINGDKDTQVDAQSNLAAVKKHCPKAEIRLMPGLNHLMQHADTGDASEYGEIRETISPEVLQIILEFIKKQK